MAKKDYLEEAKEEGKQKAKIEKLRSKGYSETDAYLISMKKKKKEKSADTPVEASMPSEEVYPYGLRLRLENDELEKLGLKELPEVGKVCKIEAEGIVESVSSNESKGDEGSRKCVEIQITSMNLHKADKSKDKDY